MVQTEEITVESFLQCSRALKDQILALLIRERMAERLGIIPFAIFDEKGQMLGAFHPTRTTWERSKTPPTMTPEQRAKVEEAMRHPERVFTLEEFMREEYPEDILPRSK